MLPPDLEPVVLADRAGIEPHRGVVDAPLDDYGVACFDDTTRSTDTRFIVITHNPITMALSIAEKSDPRQKPTTFPTCCHLM